MEYGTLMYISFSGSAAERVQARSDLLGLTPVEYVRRCLSFAEMIFALDEGEELMIKRKDRGLDHVLFVECMTEGWPL